MDKGFRTVRMMCKWMEKDDVGSFPDGYTPLGVLVLDDQMNAAMMVAAPSEWLEKVSIGMALDMMCDAMKAELRSMRSSGELVVSRRGELVH
jgi:hypothetical protein